MGVADFNRPMVGNDKDAEAKEINLVVAFGTTTTTLLAFGNFGTETSRSNLVAPLSIWRSILYYPHPTDLPSPAHPHSSYTESTK